MDYNKKVAMRAKELAQQKMENKDFEGAKSLALKAQEFSNDVQNIEQMILVCDVHCSSHERVGENEKNWYKILNIDPSSDELMISKQYRRLSLGLHPDKNKFPGALDAFQLVCEANGVLMDKDRRRLYDLRLKSGVYTMNDYINDIIFSRSRGKKRNDKSGQCSRGNNERESKKVDGLNDPTRVEGLMKSGKKRTDSVGDYEMGSGYISKQRKHSGGFDVNAQEVDKWDNGGGLNWNNLNNSTRLEGLMNSGKRRMASVGDYEVGRDYISKQGGVFDVNAQEVDKWENGGGLNENNNLNNWTGLEGLMNGGKRRMANVGDYEVGRDYIWRQGGVFDVNAQEVDKRDNHGGLNWNNFNNSTRLEGLLKSGVFYKRENGGGLNLNNLNNSTRLEGLMNSGKRKMASVGDYEVGKDYIWKQAKVSEVFNVNAQEVDKRDGYGGLNWNSLNDSTRLEALSESSKRMSISVEDYEVENDGLFYVNAQEVDKHANDGVSKVNNVDMFKGLMGDYEVELDGIWQKSKNNDAQLDKDWKKSDEFASKIDIDPKSLEYSDSQFNDFEKERSKKGFQAGQIWAVYDTLDAMPRFYALINKVVLMDFRVQITWLESDPDNHDETKWVHEGLPVSCGRFKLGESDIIENHGFFSHLVYWEKSIYRNNTYEIYPKKGETWAIFKKWDMKWYLDPERHYKDYEFDFVEILSDYDNGFGLYVGFLKKVQGYSCLFTRDETVCRLIHVKDMFVFSHRVFSFRMDERFNGARGYFELDPASICQPASKMEVIEID